MRLTCRTFAWYYLPSLAWTGLTLMIVASYQYMSGVQPTLPKVHLSFRGECPDCQTIGFALGLEARAQWSRHERAHIAYRGADILSLGTLG